MVLALGQWLSGESEQLSMQYYATARSLFTMQMLEAGTLGTVQVLLLMGNYLQKMDRPNTGYNLLGLAHRMAIGLGLHREVPSQVQKDIVARERRRQVFWTLYCFDSGFSITTGRPTVMHDAFIDTHLPRNIDDSACTLESVVPAEVDFPTPTSAIIEQSKLAMIGNQLHSGLMSIQTSRPDVKSELVLKVTQQLSEWRASLPSYFRANDVPDWFRASRAVVSWKEQNLRILLWQAVERNSATRDFGSQLNCGMAALEAVTDVTTFCKDHKDLVHPGLSWYAVYFLFQATLVLVFHELQNMGDRVVPKANESLWLRGINAARECLEGLGQDNHAARRCLLVMDRVIAGVSSPASAKTITQANSSSAINDAGSSSAMIRGGTALASPSSTDTPTMANNASLAGGDLGVFGDFDMTLPNDASPEAAAIFEDYWSTPADPSLNMFLGDAGMQGLFQDFNGFPGTVERNAFHYIDYNMYNASMFPPEEGT